LRKEGEIGWRHQVQDSCVEEPEPDPTVKDEHFIEHNSTVLPSKLRTDFEALIDIHTREDAVEKRNKLLELVWRNAYSPLCTLPATVETGIRYERFEDLDNLVAIDRLVVKMKYGTHLAVTAPMTSTNSYLPVFMQIMLRYAKFG